MPQSKVTIDKLINTYDTVNNDDYLAVSRPIGGSDYKTGKIKTSDFLDGILRPDDDGNIDMTDLNILDLNGLTVTGLTDLIPYHLCGGEDIDFDITSDTYSGGDTTIRIDYSDLYMNMPTIGSRNISRSVVGSGGDDSWWSYGIPRVGAYNFTVFGGFTITQILVKEFGEFDWVDYTDNTSIEIAMFIEPKALYGDGSETGGSSVNGLRNYSASGSYRAIGTGYCGTDKSFIEAHPVITFTIDDIPVLQGQIRVVGTVKPYIEITSNR
jgi:hypothetical protein